MVINVGALKSGDRDLVRMEMQSLVHLCHRAASLLKVIIETALLTTEEKILICQLAAAVKVDFVKTSTGFSIGGANPADVSMMRGVVGHKIGVKASAGIRSAADLLAMVEAGANRVGTSASVAIVKELGAS
jgi:deoxyribose-phosphate aldolase